MDMSITLEDKKRDYFILVENVLLVGGEDKAKNADLDKAASELLAKHKGANASLYGDLGYILLIATAGQQCQLFGLCLMPNSELVCLIPRFEVRVRSRVSTVSYSQFKFLLVSLPLCASSS